MQHIPLFRFALVGQTKMPGQLYDVIAVNIRTGAERFLAQGKTLDNAEAIVAMAVMRRGLNGEFYKAIPAPHQLKEEQ